MRLTVIGCNSPYPAANQACSGYLLEDQQTNILIDCGHSVFSKLSSVFDINKLDAVIISHFHPDHYVDLYAIRHQTRWALQQGRRARKLTLLIPSQPEDMFTYWNSMEEFEVVCIDNLLNYKIGSVLVSAYVMQHTMPVWGVDLRNSNSSLFYTADSSFNEDMTLPNHVSLLLGEASFIAAEAKLAKELGHMATIDLAKMAQIISPQLLVATHLWPEYTTEQIAQEFQGIYMGEFTVAESGKEFVF